MQADGPLLFSSNKEIGELGEIWGLCFLERGYWAVKLCAKHI